MHEAPRHEPVTSKLMDAARDAGALHVAWSGAGPSALALASDATASSVATALADVMGPKGDVLRLAIDRRGLEIS
jgi:homoserine kinase